MSVVVGLAFFFFQAEDGIRDYKVTGVQTCALPILVGARLRAVARPARAALHQRGYSGRQADRRPQQDRTTQLPACSWNVQGVLGIRQIQNLHDLEAVRPNNWCGLTS